MDKSDSGKARQITRVARAFEQQTWELHRQLSTTASEPLRREIMRMTRAKVRAATAEVEVSTGTMVQVFSLADAAPADTWSGGDPGPAETEKELNGGTMAAAG